MNIKGNEAIKADGIKILAHEKGIKKLTVKIIQFPNAENNNMCIAEAYLVGYDWDPIEKKVVEVEYTDFGDASPSNCSAMVASSFIRMASTRATARVLKNYTNVGMVSYEELGSATAEPVQLITPNQTEMIRSLMQEKGISQGEARDMMLRLCNKVTFKLLTIDDANVIIKAMKEYTSNSL